MAALEDAPASGPSLRLRFGRVFTVVAPYVNITYGDTMIQYASKLDADTYSAGDYVAFLISDESGVLVLGKQTPGTPPSLPTALSPVVANATSYATYDSATGGWTASSLVQSPHQWACWFYTTSDFSTLLSSYLATVEIEVTRTSGGPPEFATHRNTSGSGVRDLTGDTYARGQPPAAVATWVKLPIDWGQQLISGTIKGVAIGGGMNSGIYAGTGRVRLTPL